MNGKEIIKLKAKKSEMVATPLCLMQTISENKQQDYIDMSMICICQDYIYIVDYDAIAVDDILDLHKYLMKKNGIV